MAAELGPRDACRLTCSLWTLSLSSARAPLPIAALGLQFLQLNLQLLLLVLHLLLGLVQDPQFPGQVSVLLLQRLLVLV